MKKNKNRISPQQITRACQDKNINVFKLWEGLQLVGADANKGIVYFKGSCRRPPVLAAVARPVAPPPANKPQLLAPATQH